MRIEIKFLNLVILYSFIILSLANFAYSSVIVTELSPPNQTAFRNLTSINLFCNATAIGENSTVFNVSLYHNLNGTWAQAYSNTTNISNLTTGSGGINVNLPLQFSNQSNGTFSWTCLAFDNSTSNALSSFGTNRTIQIYNNFSISIIGSKPNGEIFPFSNNIFIDFTVNGPTASQLSGRFYSCGLLTNITSAGFATPLQNNFLSQNVNADNGSEQGFFPGENQGRHPPLFINQINIGTTINATATVGYKINCTDPNNVTIISSLGIFTISPGNDNFFDPSNFNFSIGGELFQFSSGPPIRFGDDKADFGKIYPQGVNILGIAQKEGPFVVSILEIGGNKFDQSPGAPCLGSDSFSCINFKGTKNAPRCSKNSSDTVRTFYTLYIDIDGNRTNNCNVTSSEDLTNYSGFDLQLFVNLSGTTTGAQIRLCNATPTKPGGNNFDNSTNYNVSSISATVDADACGFGNVGVRWDISSVKSFLNVPSTVKVQRWFAKSGNLSNVSGSQDSMSTISFYTQGTSDFIPFDSSKCFSNNDFGVDSSSYSGSSTNKDKCNAFTSGHGFLNQSLLGEECFNGIDDDGDGLIDALDDDCSFRPDFKGTDNSAPSVVSSKSDSFDQAASISWTTNEPSKGTVIFYGTNETGKNAFKSGSGSCNSAVNKTILDDPVPGQAFDDFKPFHSVRLDSTLTSLGISLSPNTTYYYKTNSTDKSNNTAISNCLNFKTKIDGIKSNGSQNVYFPFSDFGSLGAQFKLDTGRGFSNFDPTSPVSVSGGSGYNLKFAPPDNKFGFIFKGIDLSGNVSVNFSNSFKVNKSSSSPFVGMNHDTWLSLVQNLKVSTVDITVPSTGDKLFKCSDDGVSNCTDVTSLASIVGSTSSSTTWSVGTNIGFSALSMVNSTYSMVSDQTEYACFPSCSFIINYTNNNSDLANGSLYEVRVFNNTGNTQISIDTIRVLNISNLSFVNITGNVLVNLSINTSARPLQFNITVTMSAYTESRINITVEINGTRRTAFMPYVRSINLSAQPNNQNVIANNLSLDFQTTIFSDFDTNQSCNLNINSSQGVNVTNFRGINGTSSLLALGVQTIADGTYNWNVSCLNSANETAFSGETRTIILDSPPLITSISISATGAATKTNSITIQTNENATCKFAESDGDYNSTALSPMTANAQGRGHSTSVSYTSTASGTYYFRCNESNNNFMKYSNSTAFSVTTESSSSSSSSSSSGGGSSGGATTATLEASTGKQWDKLDAGTTAVVTVNNENIGVTGIIVDVKNSITSPSINVGKYTSNPLSTSAASKVYQYLSIEKLNIGDSDLSKVTINFKVPKSWLTSNAVADSDIVLWRYTGGNWNKLETKLVNSDGSSANYEAVTPGFSTFAIGNKESGTSAFAIIDMIRNFYAGTSNLAAFDVIDRIRTFYGG